MWKLSITINKSRWIFVYPVLCPKLTLIQPTWSAYPYHLVFLIWYPYSLVFLIWYPYALSSLYGNTAHCSGCGVAMGCYGLSIVRRTAIVTSQWYDRYCFAGYARTWARHPRTPWQRECTAITDFQSIDSLFLRSARRPLTSLGTSAWPYRVTTQYSYFIPWQLSSHKYVHIYLCVLRCLLLETFRNATLTVTVTVTVRDARRLWRHRIVCIWNAPNRRPNRKCQHMTVSAADNRTWFTVSGYAKFHQIFPENDIDLLYFNKQLSKCITHL